MKKHYFILAIIGLIFFQSCKTKNSLFHTVSSSHSGIDFKNEIVENDSMNILDLENIYNGGGIGIGDFNNDGMEDIYFTGNMVPCKLYLNKGDLKFEDITSASGTEGEGKWARGVAVVDINNDGWQDLYVSSTILKESNKRENILYVNQGLNDKGFPVFKNLAKEYGLNDDSHTTQSAFFDYDNDGDLDVYMAVNVFAIRDNPNSYRKVFVNGEHPSTDRLYQNNWDSVKGHPVFSNVSRQAGILQEGYAHSVTVCDINLDGWKDLFVANDYLSQNILWVNNADGTFSNQSKNYFKHTSFNAMGADVVDINNDGLSDVIELDMNPEDNYRKKTMLGSGKYQTYLYNDSYDYQYQYIRNCLHLNMGKAIGSKDSIGHPVFSDISFYSGVAETDWSWTPLVSDFDNDGFRDLIITNGFPKDITDHDFMAYRNSSFAMNAKQKLLDQIPEVKISNYAFRNNGNLKFSNLTKEWGLDLPSFSNGAVSADLDNDGDLDVVMNNINDKASLYENTTNHSERIDNHYIKIKLQGDNLNKNAFGSWVQIYYENQKQFYETNPVRGYLSSIQNIAFFGLGKAKSIDSILIIWPDNSYKKLINVKVDQQITIIKKNEDHPYIWKPIQNKDTWFTEQSQMRGLDYEHSQQDYNDFAIQTLLPHKLSQVGPYMTKGDINNDDTEDLIIGSSNGKAETIFIQDKRGKFQKELLFDISSEKHTSTSDMDLQLFDADNDGDLDLYIATGGYQEKSGSVQYQDRFYENTGKGKFKEDNTVIPQNYISKSCVRIADYDKDGDEDLFIGGRVEPWKYPTSVSSIILRNDTKNGKIKFTDVTVEIAPALKNIGLTCDATWVDFNADGWPDLVLTGEWMPICFFKNDKGKLVDQTSTTGISDKKGWWNCIQPVDIDLDGDMDFIAGNVGENSYFSSNYNYPLNNYYQDFDKNGNAETITTRYFKDKEGKYREYSMHNRDEVMEQIPVIKKKFLSYKSFANAGFEDLFDKSLISSAEKKQVNYFSTSIVKNNGNGKFELIPLPPYVQFSPVFDIISKDLDGDQDEDIFLAGNDFSAEVFNGRLNAMNGMVLRNDGERFTPLSIEESGVYIPGEGKSILNLNLVSGGELILVSQNRGTLQAYFKESKRKK